MQSLNESVFRAIWNITGNSFVLDSLSVLVSRYLGYAVMIGTILLLISHPDWRNKILNFCKLFLALVLVRGVLTSLIKFFYDSPRPAEVFDIKPLIETAGNSFPAESVITLFIFTLFAFLVSKKWGAVFAAISLLSGITQIFTGIHWPTDVLGGILLGLLGAMAVQFVSRKYEKRLLDIKPEEIVLETAPN